MFYGAYKKLDVVNGVGTRCSLFVSGCTHQCKGCFSQKTWRPDFGQEFTKEVEDKIIADLQDTRVKRDGISLLGGDPLFKDNVQPLIDLVKRIRLECPTKTVWIWSGYTLAELEQDDSAIGKLRLELVKLCDVMIDGKFEQDLADPSLLWKGSANQNVIDIKEVL